jgi:hypothetical protein
MPPIFMASIKRIKVWLNWVRSAPAVLLTRAHTVYTGLNGNPGFPKPPFPLSDLRTEADHLQYSITEASNGGKRERAALKDQRQLVVNMLRELAHYVEANCNGDELLLRSSGFEPAPTARVQKPPLSGRIRSLRRGQNSGDVVVKLVDDMEAASYQLRWTVMPLDGEPEVWDVIPVAYTRPATVVKGLKPGVTYLFQARALIGSAYTDWGDPVTYLCT